MIELLHCIIYTQTHDIKPVSSLIMWSVIQTYVYSYISSADTMRTCNTTCVCVGACYMYGACCMGVWVHSIYILVWCM